MLLFGKKNFNKNNRHRLWQTYRKKSVLIEIDSYR